MEALTKLGLKSTSVGAASMGEPEVRPELILESTTDATEWKLEVERILPQLKVTFKAENKDWRARQEQRLTYKTQIASSLKDAEAMLTRFHTDIAKSLEKISTRKLTKSKRLNYNLKYLATQMTIQIFHSEDLNINLSGQIFKF